MKILSNNYLNHLIACAENTDQEIVLTPTAEESAFTRNLNGYSFNVSVQIKDLVSFREEKKHLESLAQGCGLTPYEISAFVEKELTELAELGLIENDNGDMSEPRKPLIARGVAQRARISEAARLKS